MRNFIKKSAAIIATAVFATSFGITASAAPAETTTEADTEVTTTSISTVITENTTTTTTPLETTVASEATVAPAETTTTTGTVFVPMTDSNITDEIDISSVTINGVEVSISDITLSELLSSTGIKQFPAGNTIIDVEHLNFNSGMFGVQSDEEDILSFNGTKVSIEVVDEHSRIVPTADLDENEYDTYKVVGIHSSDFFTYDDFEVLYYGGIKTGMPKEELVAILGDGIIINNEIVYKNAKNTMIIQLEAGVIDDVTLLNNITIYPPVDEEIKELLESPYADGMLADDDLYNYVMDYLDEGVNLDTQGTGVLIGEDVINKEADENGNATETQKFTSGEKVMYSVATRDGSIFYIIIDKGANGENVYFLNSVDIVDLASLINTEDENLSTQEKEILNSANAVTGSYNYTENVPDEENSDNGADKNSNTNNNSGNTKAPTQGSNNTLYIVLGIGAVVAIGIGWYFKVGPGKKKNVGFDEEDDEDEEEEYYEEEAEEEYTEAPAEEAYDEDDNM